MLSNIAPPGSAQVLAKHDLKDATAEEIAATEKANRETEELIWSGTWFIAKYASNSLAAS